MPAPNIWIVLALGLLGGALLVLQMLVGYRKIKFKGRMHLKVHKGVAWGIAGVAFSHMVVALWYLGIWPF